MASTSPAPRAPERRERRVGRIRGGASSAAPRRAPHPGPAARSPGSFRRASWSSPRSSPGASLRDSGSVSGGGMTPAEAARPRGRGRRGDDDDAGGGRGRRRAGIIRGRIDPTPPRRLPPLGPGRSVPRGGAHSLGTLGTRFPRFVGTPSVSPSRRAGRDGVVASPSRRAPAPPRKSGSADRSDRDRPTRAAHAGRKGERTPRGTTTARGTTVTEYRDGFVRNDGRSSEARGGLRVGRERRGDRAARASGLERRRGGSEDQGPDDGEALPFALDFPEDEEEEDPDRTRIDRESTAAEEGNDDDQEARATTTGTTGTRSTLPHTTPDPKPNPAALISAEALVRMLRDAPPLTEGAVVGEPGGGAEEAEAPPRDLAWVRARLEEHARGRGRGGGGREGRRSRGGSRGRARRRRRRRRRRGGRVRGPGDERTRTGRARSEARRF